MTTFRRFFSLASATVFAASLALASELTWDFNFAPSDVSLSSVGEYTVVSLADGSNPRDAIGAPAIPAKFANILLPDGATDVSVAATGDLVLLASDITPYPVQRVAPKSKPLPPFTAPDPVAYASAAPWPAAVATCEGLHDMQGSTFVSVRVNPLVYVASEKALYYRPTVSVSVSYAPPSAAPRSSRSVSQNALATEMVNALVVNPESADSPSAVRRRAAARASSVDYLIITSSGLSSAFQNLADYRATAAGGAFKTLVVTTNDIASSYSGDDIQMKIRNCISNYVKTAGTTYVVLGGDDKIVPDRDCYAAVTSQSTYEWHMPTDLYYSDLTGTWKASGNTNFGVRAANVDMSPDVIVGRIPVRNASQLSGYLAKVQAFEADTSHTRNSIIMGGPAAWCRYYGSKRPSDDVTGDGHAAFRASNRTYVSDSEMWNRRLFRDGIKPYWKSTESSITMKIACDSITSWDSSTCGDKSLSPSNLKTWLNAGYTHFMFSGHGYPQGWGMETSDNYSSTQAAAQTNLIAFVYTDACLTGAFDEDGIKSSGITTDYGTSDQYTWTSEPCLGEAFIRNSSGGALVHMGCARYGWGTPDASSGTSAEDSDGYYTNYTATATSDGGPSTIYAYKFYKRLYESAAVASNRTLGAAFAMSKADMISQCSSDGCERWIQYGLNYLGDPAIALYPRAIEETAPAFSSATASAAAVVGEELLFDFGDLLSAGYPEPTFSIVSSASASTYEIADSLISFTPAAAGAYTFTCTAANSSGTATCTLTVTVTEPPPATPEVPATPPAAATTSFTATWSAVSDAASYKLYVQQKVAPSTSARAARDASTILTESFENDIPASWTKSSNVATATGKGGDGDTCVAFKGSGAYLITEALDNPTGVSLMYKRSSNTAAWGLDISVGPSADGPWTSVGTISSADTTWNTYETTFTASGTVYLKFTDTRSSGAAERYVDLVQVTGSSDTWVDIPGSPFTVSATSKTVSGLSADTEYRYSVTAVNAAGVESEPSSYVPVTTAAGDSAPSISVEQTSYSVTVGAPDVDFTVTVTGSPAPTVTATCTEGANFVFEDNEFLFEPATVGTYHFVFTATNSEGSDSETVTIVVSAAPITVPVLTVTNITDTTALATWTPCDGVSTYTLQLSTDFFPASSSASRDATTLLSESFEDGIPNTWSKSASNVTAASGKGGDGDGCVAFKAANVYLITPALSNPTGISFMYKRSSNTTAWELDVSVANSTDGPWTSIGTVTDAGTTWNTFTGTISLTGTVYVKFTDNRSSGSHERYIDLVQVTGTSGGGDDPGGDDIETHTVTGTSYTFTGLTPDSAYVARVKGNAAWSEEVVFETEAAAGFAPVVTVPQTSYSVTVGDPDVDFTVTATGSPAPAVTATCTEGAYFVFENNEFLFEPATAGTYHFVFTATNSEGSDSKTVTVTVAGAAPAITVPQTSYAVTVGDSDVDFTVTVTGSPASTVTATCTEGAYFVFENNEFLFEPATVGTYHFVFTATNSEGSDSETVTIVVSAAPVTVPTLLIGDETATTAYATWDECTGVTSYTLQLATDEDFTPGPGYSENFTSFTSASSYSTNSQTVDSGTWSYDGVILSPNAQANGAGSKGLAQLRATTGTLSLPAIDNPSTLTVVARASAGNLSLQQQIAGSWTTIASFAMAAEGTAFTHAFTNAGTAAALRFVAGSKATYIHDVSVASANGSLVREITTSSTSHTFTGLVPDSIYYARVKAGDGDWSTVVDFLTDVAPGTAPAIAAIADQTYVYGADGGIFTLAVSATGDPAPAFSVASADAPAGLFEIGASSGEFSFMPEATGTFHFTVTASNSLGNDSKSFTVTVTGTAPAVTVPQTSYSATLGDDVDFSVTATGNPAPTVAATCTEGAFFIFENGEFLFEADTVGTYHFVFTATSSAGSASATVTVTVAPAVVPAPTLTISNETATTADASWSAVSGASSYTLQLATDDQFTGGGSSLLTENFDNVVASNSTAIANFDNSTATPGWSGTFVYPNSGAVRVGKASSGQGWIQTPAIAVSGSISVVWTAWPWSGDAANVILGISQDGGTTFSEDTVPIATAAAAYTNTFTVSGTSVVLRWKSSTATKGRFFLDDIAVSTASTGSLVREITTSSTSHTFTGLVPDSIYYARVKAGDGDWSTVVDFLTDVAPGTAPAIAAIADQTYVYGADGGIFTLAVSATGDPAPAFSVATSDAPAGLFEIGASSGEFSFMPEATGTFHFTVTAANSLGSDSKSFAVTVTGTAPAVTPVADKTITLEDGGIEFQIVATGNPPPTFSATSTTAPAGSFTVDSATGEFTFIPEAEGTFFFVVTASNSVGSASVAFAVTVAPSVVPVPELTIANVTDTSADASWTAITGALSYTLQLGTDDDFSPASGYAEDFTSFPSASSYSTNSQTVASGTWTYDGAKFTPGGAANGEGSKGVTVLRASGTLTLPAIDHPAKVTVVARVNSGTGTLTLQQNVSDEWTTVESWTVTDSGTACSHAFANAGAAVALRLIGSKVTTIHDVAVASADGTLVEEVTLASTSHAFENLSPSTLYCARVKADDGAWSDIELFETAAPAGTAPVWSALPAQTVAVGADCDLDLAPYVSGTAPVAISMADTALDAILIGTEFSFTPAAPGTYTFTFTAANDFGSADATLTVTATGAAPVLSLSPAAESYSVAVGDPDIEFTVAATGNPAPAVSASCTEGAFFVFENGEFLFEPATPGTYHFVFTATSSAGTDSKTVTITVASSTPSVSATYTVTATNAVATTGTVPPGSSAEYVSTYKTAKQLTAGNSMTLTLKGYAGATITGLTLSMRSNAGGGGGTLSATCGNAAIAGIPDSRFNTPNWYGVWSTNYVPVTPAVVRTTVDGDVVVTISATANSLYCEAFTVTYEPGTPAGTAPVWAELPAPTVAPNEDVYLVLSDYVTGATAIAMTADSSGEAVFDDENLDFLFASATPGTYTFTFRASNGYGFSDATLAVTVAASPAETLELFFHDQSATASTFTVQGTVPGHAYELLWTSDLRSGFAVESIGTAASDTMTVPFPSTGTWFGYVRRAVP